MLFGQESSGTSIRSSYDESMVNSFIFPDDSKTSHKTLLYEELRLIERNEGEINVCWKGAHMMLFFMSFVFGSLCTCCIHRLKSMFGEKCVLFPKVVTHSTIHRMAYEFFSFKREKGDFDAELPVEFVTTQWADNNVCFLPTYVPLVSGLAGLVWTTMFLMCSSGTSQNTTGAQRHWRTLPLMFLISVTITAVCLYTSYVTDKGLRDLCSKLAQTTGSQKGGYEINVATLAYDRRVRGVYQAVLLSIASAWLHTICWLLSTLLIVARVLLAVDFTLVHVKAQLIGNVDDILQRNEKQINSFNAEAAKPYTSDIEEDSEVELFTTTNTPIGTQPQRSALNDSVIVELNKPKQLSESFSYSSVISLVPDERLKLMEIYIHDLVEDLLRDLEKRTKTRKLKTLEKMHLGAKKVNTSEKSLSDAESAKILAKEFTQKLHDKLTQEFSDFERQIKINLRNEDISRKKEGNSEGSDDKKSSIGDKLEEKKIEHEKSAVSTNIMDNNNKDTPRKRTHAVQFYDEYDTEEKGEENEQNISETNNKIYKRQLRTFDEFKSQDMATSEYKTTDNDQKHDFKEDVTNEENTSKMKDEPRKSGERHVFEDSKDDDRLSPEFKITDQNQKQDERKDKENDKNKYEDTEKPGTSGELRLFEDSNEDDKSEKKTTNKDKKQGETK